MLQDGDEDANFVTISLDTEVCRVCLRESTEEMTRCKICKDLLRNGTVQLGFNDMRELVHTGMIGHDRCFREEHYQQLQWSLEEQSFSHRGLHPITNPHLLGVPSANHLHATTLPISYSQRGSEWVHNDQRGNMSQSNPSTRSNSPVHDLGRRGSSPANGPTSDLQLLELRRNTARYLFGEDSPEFGWYSTCRIVPSTVNFKEDHFSFVDGRTLKSNLDGTRGNVPHVSLSTRLPSHCRLPRRSDGAKQSGGAQSQLGGLDIPRCQRQENGGSREHRFPWHRKETNRSVNNNNEKTVTARPARNPVEFNYTEREMEILSLDLLREILDSLQHIITETSTTLVSLLEERDALKHENDTRHVTIQKLVRMQKTVKQKSSPNLPRK